MWNTVLFDLDGTLTESGEGIMKSARYALHLMGIDVTDYNDLRSFVGPPLRDSFKSYGNMTDEEAEQAVVYYRQRFVPIGLYENQLYPGITDCLDKLKARHFTLAVASSKPEEMVWKVLKYFHIDQYFTAVVGSFADGRRTDKAAVIEECILKLGMTNLKDEIVYVGDRKYDIEGAKTVGVASIGVLYGYGSFEELQGCRPTLMADSPKMLSELLLHQAEAPAFQSQEVNGPYYGTRQKAYRPYESVMMKIWRIIYPLLIYLGISMIISVSGSIIYSVISFFTGSSSVSGLSNGLLNLAVPLTGIADAAALPIMYLLYRKDETRRKIYPSAGGTMRKTQWNALTIVLSALFIVAAAILIDLLIAVTGIGNDASYQQVNEELYSASLPVQILVLSIIGPLLEEMLLRGVIFRRLSDYISPVWAIIISAVIFGVYHGNLVQGVFAGILGIFLALLYERFGTIWVAVAGHMANNLYAVLATAFPTSNTVNIVIEIVSALVAVGLGWYLFIYKHPFRKQQSSSYA